MADVTKSQAAITVQVRYFAAAGAAAGKAEEALAAAAGATVADLVRVMGHGNSELARVLQRCSFLCDGMAVRDLDRPLQSGQTFDVLPPFAGG